MSSTGHLIVVGSLLDWNDEKGKLFEIVIQFAAILAVCWQYRRRLWTVPPPLPREPKSQRFTLNLVLAFLPAAVLGFLLIGTIKKYLFAPIPVALAFIIGGILILWIESRKRVPRVAAVDDMQPPDAIWIGFAQALSMFPRHVSFGGNHHGRVAARPVAARRHRVFLLPGHSHHIRGNGVGAVKARHSLAYDDLAVIGVGSVASFVSAAFAVRALIRYVSVHNFRVFAWYRIAFGFVILGTWYFGWSSGEAGALPGRPGDAGVGRRSIYWARAAYDTWRAAWFCCRYGWPPGRRRHRRTIERGNWSSPTLGQDRRRPLQPSGWYIFRLPTSAEKRTPCCRSAAPWRARSKSMRLARSREWSRCAPWRRSNVRPALP